jgi:hypothetical protein
MSGPPDFQTITTSITSAIGIARALISADRTFDKAELKLKLADLMVELADARTETAGMKEVMDGMAREIGALREKLEFAGSMKYETPYYFNVADGMRDGLYCATCWDGKNKGVRLYQYSSGFWICNTCKNQVEDANADNSPRQIEPDL